MGHDDIDLDSVSTEEVTAILDYLHVVLEAVYTHQMKVDKFAQKTKELRNAAKSK